MAGHRRRLNSESDLKKVALDDLAVAMRHGHSSP
jgi:hypothetical protein